MTERLTEKITNKETGEVLLYRLKGQWGEVGDNRMRAAKKLGELEDAEEEGRLVVLPCEVAWYIANKGTPYAMIMPVSINILRIIEIRNIDIDGIYYSTHEKAEKALEEMEKYE